MYSEQLLDSVQDWRYVGRRTAVGVHTPPFQASLISPPPSFQSCQFRDLKWIVADLGHKSRRLLVNCCGRSPHFVCFGDTVQLPSQVWLCGPVDGSTSAFPVLHYLPEFAQTHVHWVGELVVLVIVFIFIPMMFSLVQMDFRKRFETQYDKLQVGVEGDCAQLKQ